MSEMVRRAADAAEIALGRLMEPGTVERPNVVTLTSLAREVAVVVIAALRKPTEAMLSAGDSMMPQIAAGEDIATGYDALAEAWPAMIDAALTDDEEKPDGR